MEICYRNLFSTILLLFLASFTIIYIVLPLQLMKLSDSKSSYSVSVSLHHLSGDNDHLLAVEPASHSNSTVTRKVTKVKSREEKREEGLARARASMRRAALGDHRIINVTASTPHDGDDDSCRSCLP